MMKLEKSQDGSITQPSEQDVVLPSSTHTEKKFSKDDVLKVAILHESLSHEILSQDVHDIATGRTISKAFKIGIPEEKVEKIMDWLNIIMEKNRKSNPLSELF